MSFGVRHSILFVAEIQVASLGADQFNLGITDPPSSVIVDLIFWWISSQEREGSENSSSLSEEVEVEEGESSLLSISDKQDSSSWSSEGRIIPSARR